MPHELWLRIHRDRSVDRKTLEFGYNAGDYIFVQEQNDCIVDLYVKRNPLLLRALYLCCMAATVDSDHSVAAVAMQALEVQGHGGGGH